ncbi:MAG TPA: T9SS type A sorting domain-containing protein, partial [Chitinophagaceae bacterium]|nr:T9SS type A sorting domain-containing protein [Chitinophagaceae bacterium]
GLADAGGGDLVVTGCAIDASGGYPCGSDLSASLAIIKYEPFARNVQFFKDYNKTPYISSYGNDIKVGTYGGSNRYCVAAKYDDKAVYLQTDDNGVVQRYVLHNPADAAEASAMTMNTSGNFPVYSGTSPAGLFVVRDNFDTDCEPDIEVPVDDLPLNTSEADHNSTPVSDSAEVLLDYSLSYTETDVCGVNDTGAFRAHARLIAQGEALSNAGGSSLYPNPAVDEATLSLSVTAQEEQVEAIVTDMTGRTVQTLFSGTLKAGTHKLQLRTDKLPNAVYHVKVRMGQTTKVHSLSVLK